MEEYIQEVEMMYVQNAGGKNYSVETMGRRSRPVKLNFANVEGIEIVGTKSFEIKNSFLQLSDDQNKMWNVKFAYATNLKVKFQMGKIVIESV